MKKYLLGLGDQIAGGYKIGRDFKLPAAYKNVRQIVFFGVGGSAIAGDVIAELMHGQSPVPFSVHRSSDIPKFLDKNTLAIFSTYSGNTWETAQAFGQAVKARAKIVLMTSGGALLETAKKKKIPYLVIPRGLPPRCAIGYLTFSVLGVLEQGGWVRTSPKEVEAVRKSLKQFTPAMARKLAKKLQHKVVFLYGESAPVLKRWRAQLAENAKTLASQHKLPEMFHNEVEGWQFPKSFARRAAAVFFTKKGPCPLKNKVRMAQALIRKQGATVVEIPVNGHSSLETIFDLIYLGDWVSYELALLNKVDPVAIPVIESIKKQP
ncbi:MAG TPA: bifunctional phosphoglucose/phosphomannose isomerase [Verrucomicrobiae bacterium]|nr:bifunctional phosphoglucose/phosphomannose isomerase [Verrucomicrobiae bacterium]